MALKEITKEKVKALLRAQVEYDPERAILQMESGNVTPVCDMFSQIASDAKQRCVSIDAYIQKICAVLDDMMKELN